jgi:hypothetical protein
MRKSVNNFIFISSNQTDKFNEISKKSDNAGSGAPVFSCKKIFAPPRGIFNNYLNFKEIIKCNKTYAPQYN